VLVEEEIQPEDVKGPFNKTIPASLEKKAELKNLNYTGPQELLSEKFHIEPNLLTKLNPKVSFDVAGTKIYCAEHCYQAAASEGRKDRGQQIHTHPPRIRRRWQADQLLSCLGRQRWAARPKRHTAHSFRRGQSRLLLLSQPQVQGREDSETLRDPPGPNNPVGSTWIDLGDGFGIHGTPEPQNIGRTYSHGCIRLTNWDAKALGKMVHSGTEVDFVNWVASWLQFDLKLAAHFFDAHRGAFRRAYDWFNFLSAMPQSIRGREPMLLVLGPGPRRAAPQKILDAGAMHRSTKSAILTGE
jgi:hypothetical protein